MAITDLDSTLSVWRNALDGYTLEQLGMSPATGSWSMGQLYQHLINDTHFFMDQARLCLHSNENALMEATNFCRQMLQADAFPDARIEGSPDNAFVPRPISKEALLEAWNEMEAEIRDVCKRRPENKWHGKMQHPGLGYFGFDEWLQFTDMHLRHHLRQKERIDKFLV